MKKVIPVLVACAIGGLSASSAQALFGNPDRWGQGGDRRTLCRQSMTLAGVEEDMDDRIREVVRNSYNAMQRRPGRPASVDAGAYSEALDSTLRDAKEPILNRLLDSCTRTFTASELRGINNFYMSPAGQAWLHKGRDAIMPEMERAIADIQPRIDAEIQRRYRDETGY